MDPEFSKAMDRKLRLMERMHERKRREDQDANLHVDRAKAAEMLNVSTRTVAAAAKVKDAGAAA